VNIGISFMEILAAIFITEYWHELHGIVRQGAHLNLVDGMPAQYQKSSTASENNIEPTKYLVRGKPHTHINQSAWTRTINSRPGASTTPAERLTSNQPTDKRTNQRINKHKFRRSA
jgi:hypothetical protein